MRRAARIGLLALGLFAAGLALGTASGDPALYPYRGGDGVRVHVVDHGYHAGLVVAAPDLRAAALRLARTEPDLAHVLRAVAQDYPHADWLEFGWGDAGFYRDARTLEDVTLALVLRALLVPSLEACARTLLREGAQAVDGLALARVTSAPTVPT